MIDRTLPHLALLVALAAVLVFATWAIAGTLADRPPDRLQPGDRLIHIGGHDWILIRCDGTSGALLTGRIGGEPYTTHESYDYACADLNRRPDEHSQDR